MVFLSNILVYFKYCFMFEVYFLACHSEARVLLFYARLKNGFIFINLASEQVSILISVRNLQMEQQQKMITHLPNQRISHDLEGLACENSTRKTVFLGSAHSPKKKKKKLLSFFFWDAGASLFLSGLGCAPYQNVPVISYKRWRPLPAEVSP